MHETRKPVDATSGDLAERFKQMVGELLASLRALSPGVAEDTLLDAAVRIAASRVADEEFVWADP